MFCRFIVKKLRCDPARGQRARAGRGLQEQALSTGESQPTNRKVPSRRAPSKLKDKYQQLCRDNPNAIVELWSMDEHRLGLKPISMKNLGRNWGKSDSRCELEVSMAVVVWFCGSPVRRNLLLDSTLCQ